MKLKILSLFDGISVAQQALKEMGYDVEYYASEIDKYAIQVTQKNHPNTIQLGDVCKLGLENPYPAAVAEGVDLIVYGSPCTDLSIAKKDRQGLKGKHSGLFYEAIRIMREVPHKYFLMENVASMSNENKLEITRILSNFNSANNTTPFPILINAALVSAQNRKRLFWTNATGIAQPVDQGIFLKDILEKNVDEKYLDSMVCYAPNGKEIILGEESLQVLKEGRTEEGKKSRREIRKLTGKDSTLRSKDHKAYFGREGIKANCITTGINAENLVVKDFVIRKLTPVECERLQSLPDNYTDGGISNSQRYKCCGNAFNKEVVKHIFRFMDFS